MMANPVSGSKGRRNAEEFTALQHAAEPNANAQADPVPDLVVRYYNWLIGNPKGTDPRELLEMPLTDEQREQLIEAMDDVNVVFAITSPLRNAKAATSG